MQYCNHCKIYIKNKRERCTLCENILPDSNDYKDSKTFPIISPFYESHLVIKILVFISIAAIVISFAINIIFPATVNWPLLVIFGLLSIWLGLIVILRRGYHMPKKIVWQVFIISLLSIFWDWKIGWKGWSLNYVIPITCVSAMIIMYITAKILRLGSQDYITYALIDGFLGIVPILFIVFNWVNVIYPSIISIATSIISIAAIFIFQGEDIKLELNKRMHI
jgi:hypothetical protein